MNTLLKLVGIAVILLVLTYINTVNDAKKEEFLSKTIPEFKFKTYQQTFKACDAAMKRCNTPFCVNLNTGTGPLITCAKEYMNYFSKTNGLIPTYSSGDWGKFSL